MISLFRCGLSLKFFCDNAINGSFKSKGTINDSKELKDLQERAHNLAKKMGVQKPLHVFIHQKKNEWTAHGINLGSGPAGIGIHPDVFIKNKMEYYLKESHHFTLAHEIAHIKNNDAIFLTIIPIIFCIATLILFNFVILLSSHPIGNLLISDYLGGGAWFISFFVTSKFREQHADLEACKFTTDEEKIDLIYSFKISQMNNLYYRNEKHLSLIERTWRKIKIDSFGNNRFDLEHPYLSTRIQKIEETLKVKPNYIEPMQYYSKFFRDEKGLSFFEHRHRKHIWDNEGKSRSDQKILNEQIKELFKVPLYPFLWVKYHYFS